MVLMDKVPGYCPAEYHQLSVAFAIQFSWDAFAGGIVNFFATFAKYRHVLLGFHFRRNRLMSRRIKITNRTGPAWAPPLIH